MQGKVWVYRFVFTHSLYFFLLFFFLFFISHQSCPVEILYVE
jgi:hypothetical protein